MVLRFFQIAARFGRLCNELDKNRIQNPPKKTEVLAITAKMGWTDPDLTVGKLFRVWDWFDQHTVDGNAQYVTETLLDSILGVTGFAKAMTDFV